MVFVGLFVDISKIFPKPRGCPDSQFANFNWKKWQDEGVMKDCIHRVIASDKSTRWQWIRRVLIAQKDSDNHNYDSKDCVHKMNFKLRTRRVEEFCQGMKIDDLDSVTSKLGDFGRLECNLNDDNDLNVFVRFLRLFEPLSKKLGFSVWNVFIVDHFEQLKGIKGLEIFKDPSDVNPIRHKTVNFQLRIANDKQDCDAIIDIFECFGVIKQSIANYNLAQWNNEYQMCRGMCQQFTDMRKQNNLMCAAVDGLVQHVIEKTPIDDNYDCLVKLIHRCLQVARTN